MTTIKEHLTLMDSEAYCPSCGNTKSFCKDYCHDCLTDDDTISIFANAEPVPMYPYDYALPNYIEGYTAPIKCWTP